MKSIEKMAESHFVPSIGPVKGKIIQKIIKRHKPKTILEIGTLFGYSAMLIARCLPDDGSVVTVEKDLKTADIAKKNIDAAQTSNKIKIITGDALKIIPRLKDKFDLLFIDAAKDEYFKYLKLAEKNLKKGSVVVADNVGIFQNNMLDYLEYVRHTDMYKSYTVHTKLEFSNDIEDAIEITMKIK